MRSEGALHSVKERLKQISILLLPASCLSLIGINPSVIQLIGLGEAVISAHMGYLSLF